MTTTTRYIDPLTDFGFKHLFGSEPRKEMLIELLNALFEGEKHIIDLSYASTEHAGETSNEKKVFFDLRFTGEDGEHFVIEMQRSNQIHFKDRCIFYLSRLISGLLPKGETPWNSPLEETYLIAIMEFAFRDGNNNYLQHVALMDRETKQIFYDRMGYKFLVLANFDKEENEIVSKVDQWFYFLKNLSHLEKIPHFLDKRVFQKLFDLAEMNKLNPEQQALYESDLKAKSDYYASIQYAAVEAKEVGKIEGAIEKAKAIALKMVKRGDAVKDISEITGLTTQQIEDLNY
ncbi:Rpn family recombination-promoting nuclease/putative transposase [Pedobacter sp. PWIIR3]